MMPSNYDAQLRIRSVVADFDAYVERYRALSLETRALVRCCLNEPYGPSALECLDVFLPYSDPPGASIHVFFHGGYWRAFDKADYSFVARPIVARGAIAVIANYG